MSFSGHSATVSVLKVRDEIRLASPVPVLWIGWGKGISDYHRDSKFRECGPGRESGV